MLSVPRPRFLWMIVRTLSPLLKRPYPQDLRSVGQRPPLSLKGDLQSRYLPFHLGPGGIKGLPLVHDLLFDLQARPVALLSQVHVRSCPPSRRPSILLLFEILLRADDLLLLCVELALEELLLALHLRPEVLELFLHRPKLHFRGPEPRSRERTSPISYRSMSLL